MDLEEKEAEYAIRIWLRVSFCIVKTQRATFNKLSYCQIYFCLKNRDRLKCNSLHAHIKNYPIFILE